MRYPAPVKCAPRSETKWGLLVLDMGEEVVHPLALRSFLTAIARSATAVSEGGLNPCATDEPHTPCCMTVPFIGWGENTQNNKNTHGLVADYCVSLRHARKRPFAPAACIFCQ